MLQQGNPQKVSQGTCGLHLNHLKRPRSVHLTLRVETRSAVSRRVNWLIWSTIVEIFGLVAASVEFHRRWARVADATLTPPAALKERTALLAANWQDKDIVRCVKEGVIKVSRAVTIDTRSLKKFEVPSDTSGNLDLVEAAAWWSVHAILHRSPKKKFRYSGDNKPTSTLSRRHTPRHGRY